MKALAEQLEPAPFGEHLHQGRQGPQLRWQGDVVKEVAFPWVHGCGMRKGDSDLESIPSISQLCF